MVLNMELLIVCSSLSGGGAEKVAANLANALSELGDSVAIFCRPSDDVYWVAPAVEIIHPDRTNIAARIFSLSRLLRNRSFDVILSFTDVSNIDSWIASRAASFDGIRVATVHNDLKVRDSQLPRTLKNRFLYYLHRHACLSASKVIAVSRAAMESFCEYYNICSEHVVYIYNPVISDDAAIHSMKSGEKCKQSVIRLAAVGRLTEQKNYPMMLDVVEILNQQQKEEYRLDIYGKGSLLNELEARVRDKKLSQFVSFRGFSSSLDEELPKYDFFILTSDWEGFGNVLVEAMMCGLPVVSTACPSGPEEVLQMGRFGTLVEKGNALSFADAIASLVQVPHDVDQIKLEQHLNQFRLKVVAKKYRDVFSSC